MKKFDFYDVLGAIADAAVKKSSDKQKEEPANEKEAPAAPAPAPVTAPAPTAPRKSFADRKTVVEMIRRHDELSRKITENAKKAAEAEEKPVGI